MPIRRFLPAVLLLLPAGCPDLDATSTLPASEVVLGTTVTADDAALGDVAGGAPAVADFFDELSISGRVNIDGDYRLYELGASNAGDSWRIETSGAPTGPLVAALFDADRNLIFRSYVSRSGGSFQHQMREFSGQTYLGIMAPVGGPGASFRFSARRTGGGELPTPRPQVVYLNFAGATGVRVHGNAPIAFGEFAGETIGGDYTGRTQEIKNAVVEVMRSDYAAFNVEFLSSDDGPPPAGCSTVHFGGYSAGLLGLADNVDSYNENPIQTALIYIESFQPYQTMKLTPAELGVMIGNVASHELGHLMGLYHTQSPSDIMDTTGSAWDLAGDQAFARAQLEPTVFATGSEDSRKLLTQAVGVKSDGSHAKGRGAQTPALLDAKLRAFSRREAHSGCGTCRRLDEHRE